MIREKHIKILNGIRADIDNSKLILNLPTFSDAELLGHEATNLINLKDALHIVNPESAELFTGNIEENILDRLDEDYFIELLQKTTDPHGAALAFVYWYVIQLIAREINKRIYREVYQHFRETSLHQKTEGKGDYMLTQLWEWANHAVIDSFTSLVGIEPGADLERVYAEAKAYTINFSFDDLANIAGSEQKERSDNFINLIVALAYRSMAAEKVLQKETQFGRATFTMQKNNGRTATQADEIEHVRQLINVAGGIEEKRFKNIANDDIEENKQLKKKLNNSYRKQIIEKVKENLKTLRDAEARKNKKTLKDSQKTFTLNNLHAVQNDFSVEFWSRFNETKRLIEKQNWKTITLPVIKLESPHPEWKKFIIEKTREAIKKYAAENYDLYKDWPELKRCCDNAIKGMAEKMSGDDATQDRKVEQSNEFEYKSEAKSLQDKAYKDHGETTDIFYDEMISEDNAPRPRDNYTDEWLSIGAAIRKLYKDEKGRLIEQLLRLKALPQQFTEEQLSRPISVEGFPPWPGMPISTQKLYLKQIKELIQEEEN